MKNLSSLFAATALAAGFLTMNAKPAEAQFTTGAGPDPDGSGYASTISLVKNPQEPGWETTDNLARHYLPHSDTDQIGYRNEILDILKPYVEEQRAKQAEDGSGFETFQDHWAGRFLWFLETVSAQAGMTKEAFFDSIDITPQDIEILTYKSYRDEILSPYEEFIYLTEKTELIIEPKLFWLSSGLSEDAQTIEKINNTLQTAREQYPQEEKFRLPLLTSGDLQAVRQNIAEMAVAWTVDFIDKVQTGQTNPSQLDFDEQTNLEYAAQILSNDWGSHIFSESAQEYNEILPDLVDEAFAQRGVGPEKKKEAVNFINRLNEYYEAGRPEVFIDSIKNFPIP